MATASRNRLVLLLRRSSSADSSQQPARRRIRRLRWLVVSVICIGLLVFGGLKLLHHSVNLDNVDVITSKISRHYLLPTNEKPALATVTDSTKVQSAFAGKVANGDKILIYQTNKKAIVYRPSVDRIVDVEPVSIDTPPSAVNPKL